MDGRDADRSGSPVSMSTVISVLRVVGTVHTMSYGTYSIPSETYHVPLWCVNIDSIPRYAVLYWYYSLGVLYTHRVCTI